MAFDSLFKDRDSVHLWSISLDDPSVLLINFDNTLSQEEIARANRFAFDHLKTRFKISHGILRILLSHYLKKHPLEIEFTYNLYGKPFLKENTQDLYFNMSHSHHIALYAIAGKGDIGVDVELIRDITIEESLCDMILSRTEKQWFNSLEESNKIRMFFYLWTSKEAFVKAKGVGLSFPLKQINIPFHQDSFDKIIKVQERKPSKQEWALYRFEKSAKYIGAVAIKAPLSVVEFFNLFDLINVYQRDYLH